MTLTIKAGTPVPENPDFQTMKDGDFQPLELVEVEYVKKPGSSACAFQAFFIVNGRSYDEAIDGDQVKEDPATNPDVQDQFANLDAASAKLKNILGVK